MNIDDLLREAVRLNASDVHLKTGSFPRLRVNGDLVIFNRFPRVTADEMQAITASLMNERQRERFHEMAEIDLAYSVEGLGRFRVNVFHEMGFVGMVLRIIPVAIRTVEELGLPPVVSRFCDERRGLLLVTGATGSGKSTTLAAMIDRVNSTRAARIVTIEDPIEFYHTDKMGLICQREVGVDTPSFDAALRAALRQDPDVILVGEMRDRETMRMALAAAETGHMVFSTLHTLDAQETVQRLLAAFSASEQRQIRLQLAGTLRGIVSQRLVRRADGKGRIPAAEILVPSEFVRDCIVNEEKTRSIHDLMVSGKAAYDMQTFDQSLYDLYSRRLITLEEAALWASSADELRLRAAGIRSASEVTHDAINAASRAGIERFGQA
jgi:twitching motility protein PilT